MTSTPSRRPLPALIFLLALTLLTALVWWRVLHRGTSHTASKKPCTTQSPSAGLPRPKAVTLSVLNGTDRSGLAKTTAASLRKDGFTVSGVGNDTKHIPGIGEIRYAPSAKTAATLVSYYLPGAKLVQIASTSNNQVIVSLGATYKKLATAAAVSTAMTTAHTSFAPSPAPTSPSAPASC
jgi:hypothetical protein